MKNFLALIVSLLILCCAVNAQDISCKITKKGCGKIKVERSQKEIEKILGKPDKVGFGSLKTDNDFFYTEFYSKGISVIYKTNTKTVQEIHFYNNDSSAKDFAVFPNAKTANEIDWKSTPDDVIKVCGKPKDDFNGNEYNENWRRIVYPRMDFRFENNKLVRIGVFVKEKKEKVQPI